MGVVCCKTFHSTRGCELEDVTSFAALLLTQLGPEELLKFALEDSEIYNICKNHADLRQSCIIAAVRKYHSEKLFHEEVFNRTADYMALLDNFLEIQDEIENKEFEKTRLKYLPCFYRRNRDRVGDAAQNGEE